MSYSINTPIGQFSPNPDLLNKAGSQALSKMGGELINRKVIIILGGALVGGVIAWYMLSIN